MSFKEMVNEEKIEVTYFKGYDKFQNPSIDEPKITGILIIDNEGNKRIFPCSGHEFENPEYKEKDNV